MEIPGWLKGLTPKKIAPDSPATPAETPAQPSATDAIPAPDKTRAMGEEETVEAPVADNLNVSADKLPDWLIPEAPAVSAPLPADAKDQIIEGSFAAAPTPDKPVQTDSSTDGEIPVSASSPEADSLKARAREDFQKRGYKYIETDENGVEVWYHAKAGRGEINPTVTSEHEEKKHDEWFDQTLEAAKSPEEAAQALESKLIELEQRAGEKAKKVDSIEAERDRLRSEMAAIEDTAREGLPRGKSPSSMNKREYLIKTRNRYWEIKARLDEINGTDDQIGEIDSAREELAVEGSTQKGRRLRKIRQIRGEMEQFQNVIENPMLLDEYRRLRSGVDSASVNLVSAAAEAYKREVGERLLELESQLPVELIKLVKGELHPTIQGDDAEAKDVNLSAIEKAGAFEENAAYGKAVIKLKELIENQLQAIKLTLPSVESGLSAPTAESADEAQQTIIDLKARVAQLEAELANKAPSPAETAESNEDEIINQLPEQVRQRLAEVGKITPQDGQQARGLEDKIGKMIAEGVESGEINKRLAEMIKRLPESEQEAARDSLQRQLMARSIEISRDGSLTPDEKKRRINSLIDLAKGVAETGELVFPGLGGLFDFLMQNIVDSLNTAK
jgi:uncharacterized protein Yka (UPF0111/DUF47 family)